MIVIGDPKTFNFDFKWPKDNEKNLTHKREFISKRNKSLAENKIKKNKIKQLLSKYKHENDIHQPEKQQNQWTT